MTMKRNGLGVILIGRQYLIKSQLQTLKMFRDRNAIISEQYEEALEYLRKSSTYDSEGSN